MIISYSISLENYMNETVYILHRSHNLDLLFIMPENRAGEPYKYINTVVSAKYKASLKKMFVAHNIGKKSSSVR